MFTFIAPSKLVSLAFITWMVLMFTGCGSSSSGSSDSRDSDIEQVLTGTFLDGPVANIHYRTQTQQGRTNNLGEFKYLAGETIIFSIGGIDLPSVSCKEIITPLDLSSSNDIENFHVANIAQFLQTLSTPVGESLIIDEQYHSTFSERSIDFASLNFETELRNLLTTSGISESILVDRADALLHLYRSLSMEYPDSDGDTVYDRLDAFPLDANEWEDTDKDGIGDNSDAFPDDPYEHRTHCIRFVQNLLSLKDNDLSQWSSNGLPISFSDNNQIAYFNLDNQNTDRLFIAKEIKLSQNTFYTISLTVTDFVGAFGVPNLKVLAVNTTDFHGVSGITFSGNGDYALSFNYTGPSSSYLLRVGIGTDDSDTVAINNRSSQFKVSNIKVEPLTSERSFPSEYVPPGQTFGFNYPISGTYDSESGLYSINKGATCGRYYQNVWAITGDSFANDETDFPGVLQSRLTNQYAFYTDAVAGRTLSAAAERINNILDFTEISSDAAKPIGLIVEGGVNDLFQNKSGQELIKTAENIITIASNRQVAMVFLTIAPFGNNPGWNASRENARLTYNNWLLDSASQIENLHILDIAQIAALGGLADNQNLTTMNQQYATQDGLHPNSVGQQVIATRLEELLKQINYE